MTPDANTLKEAFLDERPCTTDGRRLSLEVRGFEGFVVESADQWEIDPFLAMPHFDVSLSTLSDSKGSMLHINSKLKTLLIQYSLYRHYAIGIAVTAIRKAVMRVKEDMRFRAKNDSTSKLVSSRGLLTPNPKKAIDPFDVGDPEEPGPKIGRAHV